MAEKQEGLRLVGVVGKSLVPLVSGIDKIFVFSAGNPIQIAVIEIEGDKLVVKPCDINGNLVEDSSKHQNFPSSSLPAD